MSAKDTVRKNKVAIQRILCGDYKFILNKAFEKKLITERNYNNLKSINKATVEEHVVDLVDNILNRGEDCCGSFLKLLQTDQEVRDTFPELGGLLNNPSPLPEPVQVSSVHRDDEDDQKKRKAVYELKSRPVGLCVIINNKKFDDGSERRGTDQDARSLAQVFSWLGFRVLMCSDQTRDQMTETLTEFASLSDLVHLERMGVQEWRDNSFTALQQDVEHGDAFICCILSHGRKGVVLGIDRKPLPIKQVTRTFKATERSALTNKPKVFVIQACQGGGIQPGVLVEDLEEDDDGARSIPEEADVLVAMATVEDYRARRNRTTGSWFVQSLCQQLKQRCPSGEDLTTILLYVNDDVARRERVPENPGEGKQMPEVRYTLTKTLVLTPPHL